MPEPKTGGRIAGYKDQDWLHRAEAEEAAPPKPPAPPTPPPKSEDLMRVYN